MPPNYKAKAYWGVEGVVKALCFALSRRKALRRFDRASTLMLR